MNGNESSNDTEGGDEMREYRRARLQALIDKDGGNRAAFAKKVGIGVQRLADYLNPKLNSFGPRAARSLEKDLHLDTYYFDAGSLGAAKANMAGPSLRIVEITKPARTEEGEKLVLSYLTYEELRLLSQFRESTEIGRGTILSVAENTTKIPKLRDADG